MSNSNPVPGIGGSFIRQKDGSLVPNLDDPEMAARAAAVRAAVQPETEPEKPASKPKLKEA